MQSETLSRESSVTESAKEIVDSIPLKCECYSYNKSCQLFYNYGVEVLITRIGDFAWRVSVRGVN
jgi:hypothetical protein